MQFDNSWTALFRPDRATEYFDFERERRIDPEAADYSPINALWLAELSRLVYRREASEVGRTVAGPSRAGVLERVGLVETHFFDRGGTQCAIVRPSPERPESFAVVVFRGTLGLSDWVTNLNLLATPTPLGGNTGRGFSASLGNVWERLDESLETIDGPLFYAGHSLGGVLATLAAARRTPHALYTFGSPRAGDAEFAGKLTHASSYRVVNNRDLATRVPPGFIGAGRAVHVAELCRIGPDSSVHRGEHGVIADFEARVRRPEDSRSTLGPPRMLADHAPANYVAHLERSVVVRNRD